MNEFDKKNMDARVARLMAAGLRRSDAIMVDELAHHAA